MKTSSSKTNCKAMLRLHRTSDDAWVVVEHISEHNHPLSETYGEKKHWPSHHHLDKYTKDLIRLLRNNNIGITKLYTILEDFFGSMQNVPATKRCLKSLCQKINREQAEDDIKKTLALVRELRKSDPGFMLVLTPTMMAELKLLCGPIAVAECSMIILEMWLVLIPHSKRIFMICHLVYSLG